MKNWTGNISWNPAHFFLPNSKEELKRIIEDAIEIKQNIRVIGSGHSFSPLCATSGYTISLDNLQYIQQNASDNKLVDIQGGAKLYQISEELNKLAMAGTRNMRKAARVAGQVARKARGKPAAKKAPTRAAPPAPLSR